MRKKKVMLLGSYGRGNIGDDAFLVAAYALLKDHELIINSGDNQLLPEDIRHSVKTIKTDSLPHIFKAFWWFFQASHIVYGGGDLWVELHGNFFPRSSLWKMYLLNALAKATGKKIFYLGCGTGQLEGFSLKLARASASLADLIIARDAQTVTTLKIQNAETLPDLSVNLFSETSPIKVKNEVKTIGISVMYYIPEPKENFRPYLNRMADFMNEKMRTSAVHFNLLPMLISKTRYNDIWASRELMELIRPEYRDRVTLFEISDFYELRDHLQGLDLMIGTRLHANILSVLSGVPAIGIAYRPKVYRFFESIHLERFSIHVEDLHKLSETYDDMIKDFPANHSHFLESRRQLLAGKHAYESTIQANL